MLSLIKIIIKELNHLHLNCILAFSWINVFRSITFLMIEKQEMKWLIFINWAHMNLQFCRWLDCVMWLYSAACSDEHAMNLCTFQSLAFWCSFFWMLLSHDIKFDFAEFLICISCLTVFSLCHADVRLMLQMQFLISL